MALVVLLRGVNIGGHRTFRPTVLARRLRQHDVVSVGAAGTFVVRRPGRREALRAELLERLPFVTEVVFCDGRDLIELETDDPFAAQPSGAGIVRFVSILKRAGRGPADLPLSLPPVGHWYVRLIGRRKRFVFGVYRRHMKTIGYLGQLDRLFGARATTRNWNTILAVVRVLKGGGL